MEEQRRAVEAWAAAFREAGYQVHADISQVGGWLLRGVARVGTLPLWAASPAHMRALCLMGMVLSEGEKPGTDEEE